MTNIYGIGPVLLEKLLPLLRGRDLLDCYNEPEIYELLPSATRAYLKYRPVEKLKRSLLEPLAHCIEMSGGIVSGSYRRGTEYCRDIDILISKKKLPQLRKNIKFTRPHAEGEEIIRCFVKIKQSYMFVDIFIYNKQNKPYMLLYTTGSKQFNQNMRGVAKTKGMRLNQNGLFKNNELVGNAKTEEDIFILLGMNYMEPYQRNL